MLRDAPAGRNFSGSPAGVFRRRYALLAYPHWIR